MARVQLEDVVKQYEDVTAVDNMNLDIRDGEFVVLVGPSGCGKSTTMETVAGLTKPTSGTVRIGDRDVTNLPPKDRGISMVFQNIALFPHMDVHDNISFGLRLRDYEQSEIDERVERAAEVVQMEGMLDRMPDEMSGGQRQRVAIARAIVREPEVFLMDEPLANLDAKLRVTMRTELQRLQKNLDTTVIYVTHNQAEAMTMADRIAVLNAGELQQIDPPLTCYNEPANLFVAGFIGSPSMNFARGQVAEEGYESVNSNIAVEFDPMEANLQPGQAVTLGVRPEDVFPAEDAGKAEAPTDPISVTTDVLEPMGDEIFVYLLTEPDADVDIEDQDADYQVLMSVPPDSDVQENQEMEVVFDRSNVHLFDTDSEEALLHGLMNLPGGGAGAGRIEAGGDD
ncbi:MAG: ABC transporter ATP-binding protein [Haloglomus sp.]